MNAQTAIARARRDLTLSAVIRMALLAAVVFGALVAPMFGLRGDGMLLLVVVAVLWVVLSYQSLKGSRMAAASPGLIAAGQYEEAERVIDGALRSFSLSRTVKLMSLHHLAMLRHAQKRYQEAAALCRELLEQRLGAVPGVGKQSRLILADALLEMNDLQGAYEILSGLYRQRLSLSEAMNLLQVELDYQARVGAWEAMMHNLPAKVQLAELLPSPATARAQAMLALAAKKTGVADWSDFLRRRAEILADVQELTRERPMLWELWKAA